MTSSLRNRSALIRPSVARRHEIVAVVHVVLAHDRHRREGPGRPVLVGDHPALAGEGDVDERIEHLLALLAGQAPGELAGALAQVEPAALLDDRVQQLRCPARRCACESVSTLKPAGEKTGLSCTPSSCGRDQPLVQALHEPGEHAADRDRVEAVHVGVVVQPLGGPLVEDAAQRAHGLVGLVVLLELVAHLLADRRARLAAGVLLLGGDGLLVELPEVVVDDELLVQVAGVLPPAM